MNLEKLFGSKAKVDILKYLLFKRQGVSLRALESDLSWTFPAIKKQVDSLMIAGLLDIDKSQMKRSICLREDSTNPIKAIFVHGLQRTLQDLFSDYEYSVYQYFFGKVFGRELPMDLVLIHQNTEKDILDVIKKEIREVFHDYFITTLSVTCMSLSEWQKRYRLADKFVLQIL